MAKSKCMFGFGILAFILGMAIPGGAADMGTAITYQGRLHDNGEPGNDDYDFQFKVYDALVGGAQVGVIVAPGDVTVTDGVFTEVLDFGAGVFDGAPRWLEIGVRPGDSVGPYKILEPRQELTPNPYSLYAKAAGAVVGGIGMGGSGTADYIAKFQDSDTLTDSIIYESTGKIGIGTASPDEELVIGTPLGSGWAIPAVTVGGERGGVFQCGTDTYKFSIESGTTFQRARIISSDADGFGLGDIEFKCDGIGIGNGDPAYRLDVGNTSEANNYVRIRSQNWAGLLFYDDEGSHSGNITYYHGDDSMRFQTRTGAAATEKMRITTDGDVGIGTTAPTHKLTVSGDVKGLGILGPTNGYLGVQGAADYDGVTTADWAGDEIGVAGISTGASVNDNYGVLGHSNNAGVRGEYSGNPTVDYGELGTNGVGVYGSGSTWAGRFDGNVRVDGNLEVYNNSGTKTVHLENGGESYMYLYDGSGSTTSNRVLLWADAGNGGKVWLTNNAGANTIFLDGDVNGDGRITTQELTITGGSDLSEQFDVNSEQQKPQPGMVVCIDKENPGKLAISQKSYDRTVAGIISGAGGVETGMMMSHQGTLADGEYPVALTGRAFCWCDTSNGPIEPGDLLTTSDTPGNAMRVTDHLKGQGSILGKAMTKLEKGQTGLVLVLVNLQ